MGRFWADLGSTFGIFQGLFGDDKVIFWGFPGLFQLGKIELYNFSKQFIHTDIKILGCGGVENGSDVFEYILAGAAAVQVGTQFYREGCHCFKRIRQELINLMKKKH